MSEGSDGEGKKKKKKKKEKKNKKHKKHKKHKQKKDEPVPDDGSDSDIEGEGPNLELERKLREKLLRSLQHAKSSAE